MEFRLGDAIPVLTGTPTVLAALLDGLSEASTTATEGDGTWSPYDVVGHLIHGERTNWMPRVHHLLRHGETTAFPPFDREAMFAASRGQSLDQLLDSFAGLRRESLADLRALQLGETDLERPGRHPALGRVTLGQLLAAWVVHDRTHVAQIVRVLARQYETAVGPWRAYLSVLAPREGGRLG